MSKVLTLSPRYTFGERLADGTIHVIGVAASVIALGTQSPIRVTNSKRFLGCMSDLR